MSTQPWRSPTSCSQNILRSLRLRVSTIVGLKKNEVMNLLKLALENCVFLFQGNFFKQLHGATMSSPCSPMVAGIYMEYFEDLALGPELPIPIKEWKRHVDDIFSIILKGKRDTMLNYLNP